MPPAGVMPKRRKQKVYNGSDIILAELCLRFFGEITLIHWSFVSFFSKKLKPIRALLIRRKITMKTPLKYLIILHRK